MRSFMKIPQTIGTTILEGCNKSCVWTNNFGSNKESKQKYN